MAARIAYQKTGVVASLDKLTAADLTILLDQVMNDHVYRDNTRKMQKAIAEADGLSMGANLIEQSLASAANPDNCRHSVRIPHGLCFLIQHENGGLGRAPGTDMLTARALRRDLASSADSFPRDVQELQSYFEPAAPDQKIRAVPGAGLHVPIWLLGSSPFSAQLAAMLGLPFAFASHFAPDANCARNFSHARLPKPNRSDTPRWGPKR